jgi:hypothetical protein
MGSFVPKSNVLDVPNGPRFPAIEPYPETDADS